MPTYLRLLPFLIAGALLSAAIPVSARQVAGQAHLSELAVGIDGVYKIGYWAPVRLTVTDATTTLRGRLAITTPDHDGTPTTFLDDRWLTIAPGQQVTVESFVKFGRRGQLRAEFQTESGVVARREWSAAELPQPLSSDQRWVLMLGPRLGLSQALPDATVTPVADLTGLPRRWHGYEGVDIVALTTSRFEQFELIGSQQITALRQWVHLGGQLLMCVGASGQEVLAESSPLRVFSPGPLSRVLRVRNLPALESYVSGAQAIHAADTAPDGSPLSVTLLKDPRGKVLVFEQAAEGLRPLVVRAAVGLGQVIFIAVDLDQPPFADWEGRPRLLNKLVEGETAHAKRTTRSDQTGQVVHLGYNDLVGQLRTALDQFSGIKLVAFSWVAGLIVAYILLIGPADYFLLKDVVRRMQWTWVSLPLLALLFCVLSVWLHTRYKSSVVKINQVDLVDVDVASGIVRGTTWAHVFSPRTAAFDVRLSSPWLADSAGRAGSLLSWQGLPGTGLGGLEANLAAIFTTPYVIEGVSSASIMQAAPIQVDGTKALIARWWLQTDISHKATLRVDADGLLRGEVTNPLPVELTECTLLYENWAYRLERKGGVLAPGDSTRIEVEKASNLNWRLTRRRVVEIKDVTTPWNQRDLDIPRLMEMMMFHEAAGGRNYTRLQHRYQPYVDLTGHLKSGQAILMGRADQPASHLILNEETELDRYDQQWTFYRVVFPVQRSIANDARR